MKNIQSLTLMMAVMVYAAAAPTTTTTTTLSPEDKEKVAQLNDIIDTVNTILLHNKGLNFTVPGVIPEGFPTCTKEFFCMAEKSLNTSTEIKNANLTETVATNVTKLKSELHQYNNLKKVHCHLEAAWERPSMNKFLEDIKNCTVEAIKNATKHG